MAKLKDMTYEELIGKAHLAFLRRRGTNAYDEAINLIDVELAFFAIFILILEVFAFGASSYLGDAEMPFFHAAMATIVAIIIAEGISIDIRGRILHKAIISARAGSTDISPAKE